MPLLCAKEVCNSDNTLFYRLGRLRSAVHRTKSLPLFLVRSVSPYILAPGELVERRRNIGNSVNVSLALTLRAYLSPFGEYFSATNTSVCIRHCYYLLIYILYIRRHTVDSIPQTHDAYQARLSWVSTNPRRRTPRRSSSNYIISDAFP